MTEAIRGNVLAMVAEMESKVNDNAEKAKSTDMQQELMKKIIAGILQDVEENSRENNVRGRNGLENIKDFLTRLSTLDLGTELNDYVKEKLDEVGSYKPDQGLVDQLKKDEATLEGLEAAAPLLWWLYIAVAVYQKKVAADKQAIQNDPSLPRFLNALSSGNEVVISQANQKLGLGQASMKNISEVENTINAMVKLFQSA